MQVNYEQGYRPSSKCWQKDKHEMNTVGIDIGSKVIKAAICVDGAIVKQDSLARGMRLADEVLEQLLASLQQESHIDADNFHSILVTGRTEELLNRSNMQLISMPLCTAKGAYWVSPTSEVALDIGAENFTAVKCNNGKPLQIANNSSCAGTTGIYLEMTSDLLKVKVDEIGQLALQADSAAEIQNLCAIFAESEIISKLHAGNSPASILKGVCNALALQIYSLIMRVGFDRSKDIVAFGGIARNTAIIKRIQELTGGCNVIVPEYPETVNAVGAALIGAERYARASMEVR